MRRRNGPTSSTPAALELQREDLIAVSRALQSVSSRRTRGRGDQDGLAADRQRPARTSAPLARPSIAAAADSAAAIKLPGLFEESEATSLTGPASQLAGLFSSLHRAASHGWQQIVAAIDAIEHGSPAGARFARENVALYIDSVYDGHFSLAQIGKKLLDGSHAGGQPAFGETSRRPK